MPPRRKAAQRAEPANDDDSDGGLEIVNEEEQAAERPRKRAAGPGRNPRAAASGGAFAVSDAEKKAIYTLIEKYKAEERKRLAEAKNLPDRQELEELAGRVVRAMLFKQQEKPGQPVRRQDLVDAMKDGGTSKGTRNLPAVVIPMAQARMASVFGIDMKELERDAGDAPAAAKKAAAADDGARPLEYVLESMLPPLLRREFVDAKGGEAAGGLAVLVMALIFLEGGKLAREQLVELLDQVGVRLGGPRHPTFGDAEEELKKLEAKRWLVTRKRRGGADGGETLIYERGEVGRAHITDQELKQFIEQEFNKTGLNLGGDAEGADNEAIVLA